jgi:non-homologous end joining protein Ku
LLVEQSFFVLPDWGSERAYTVLLQALSRSGRYVSTCLRHLEA